MPTPKLNRIITEFGNRIGFPVTYTGTVLDNSDDIDADEYVALVNKAMFKLFNDMWVKVGGDQKIFIGIFPELLKEASASVLTDASGRTYLGQDFTFYDIASPVLDLFLPFQVNNLTDDILVKVKPTTHYNKILERSIPQLTPSATNQMAVLVGTRLFIFPGVKTQKSLLLTYIHVPLNPTDGAFLLQNGSYDSPFNDMWNSRIAAIAEELWLIDTKETT